MGAWHTFIKRLKIKTWLAIAELRAILSSKNTCSLVPAFDAAQMEGRILLSASPISPAALADLPEPQTDSGGDISANAANIGPTNNIPSSQSVDEDATLEFSPSLGNGISVSDPDVGSNSVEVSLTATNGVVSVDFLLNDETLINTYTTEDQKEPDVAMDDIGNYVVVWASKEQDGDAAGDHNIYARLYDSSGVAQSGEIQVNTSVDNQKKAAVAMDADGDFVVVWETEQNGTKDVFARLFDPTGTPTSAEIAVNTTTLEDQKEPDVSMDSAGNFVVTWESKGQDGDATSESNVYLRRYDNTGTALSGEVLVNTSLSGTQKRPEIAIDTDGDFVVVWEGNGDQSGNIDDKGVFFQRYDSTGNPQGTETLVNTTTANDEKEAAIAISSGGDFVIAWEGSDSDKKGVFFQRYDAVGSAQGSEAQVNLSETGDQKRPEVAVDAEGDIIITWEGESANDDKGIYSREYTSLGSPQSGEQIINSQTTEKQERSAVATSGNGDFIVVWQSDNQDGDKKGVYAQQVLRHEVLSFSVGDGAEDATMTFTASLENANIVLDGTTFTPTPNYYGSGTLQIQTNDLGNTGTGGPLTDDDTIALTINPVNDAPVNQVPGTQTTDEDTSVEFSTAQSTLISISDIDDEGQTHEVTLNATNGTITLSGIAGLAFNAGDGTNDPTMTFVGTATDINTALDGLTFLPTPDFNGSAGIQIITDDMGNTGTPGALADDDSVSITVNATNDDPVITSNATPSVSENSVSVVTVTASDVDLDTPTFSITGGNDSALFNIIAASGILTFNTPPNFEIPGDNDSDNVYQVEVTADDGNSGTDTQLINVSVTNANEAPTGILPTDLNLNENTDTTGGTSLGTLIASDPDSSDTFTYTIHGGADAASFSIGGGSNDELVFDAGIVDFETKDSYTVTVRVTDSGLLTHDESITVNVNDLNEAPTAILPTNFNVNENTDTSGGLSLGTLTTSDPDSSDTFTYTIQSGVDSASFSIGGGSNNELVFDAGTVDFETKDSYTVTVRVTDSGLLTHDESITVNVNDLNEAPTTILPTNFNVNENTDTSGGLSLGTFTTSDPDSSDTFTYTIHGGADAASFSIGGGSNDELVFDSGTVDFETKESYTVTVRVTDSGLLTHDESITVNVNDLNEAPTTILPTNFNVNENTDTSGGLSLGTLTTSDPDSSDNFTYTIQGGVDAASFSIGGGSNDELVFDAGIVDFETKDSYTVTVRVTDSGLLNHDESITVNVIDLNEAPTAVLPTNFNISDNTDTTGGVAVGTLSASDPDFGDTFTYTIQGGADAASFSIGGAGNDQLIFDDGLISAAIQASYSVTVRVFDAGLLIHDEALTLAVSNVNHAPTAISPTSVNVNENTDSSGGISLATLTATDPNVGDTFNYSIQGGADAAVFTIGGAANNELVLDAGLLNFEAKDTYAVIVRVTDSGSLTHDESITIRVNDFNEAPTAITPTSLGLNENTDTTGGISLGILNTSDPDTGETFAYNIQGGADAAAFSIGGGANNELVLDAGLLNFEAKDTYTATVRVTDSGSLTHDESITIHVNDLNEAPTAVTPTSFDLNENTDTTGGISLGTLNTSDPDTGETFTYNIQGGADAAAFSIGGGANNELVLDAGLLNFEVKDTYTATVRVTDSGSLTHDESITIHVNDLNEAPTINLLSVLTNLPENSDTSAEIKVADIIVTDDAVGTNRLVLSGDDASSFTIVGGSELFLKAGVDLDAETNAELVVVVSVNDLAVGGDPDDMRQITIVVANINEAPVALDDEFNVERSITVASPGILANDSDPEEDSLVIRILAGPQHGTLDLRADGGFTYTASASFSGVDEFSYQIEDGMNAPSSATVRLYVGIPAIIPPPVANPIPESPPSDDANSDDERTDDSLLESSPALEVTLPTVSLVERSPTTAHTAASELLALPNQSDKSEEQNVIQQLQLFNQVSTNKNISSNARDLRGALGGIRTSSESTVIAAESIVPVTFLNSLDQMNEVVSEGERETRIVLGSSIVVSTGLSVGYLIWLVRGGVLLGSVLTSLPAWTLVDPLPVLGLLENRSDGAEDDSLETLVNESNIRHDEEERQ